MRCRICARGCELAEGALGFCGARRRAGNRTVPENYGRITSLALDPIEKKPLAMYEPGAMILSVGSYGCNLDCPFCQNHSISRARAEHVRWEEIRPEELCRIAEHYRSAGNIGVAFTYNEPLISFEYMMDTAALLHEAGMKSVLVSNGSVSEDIAREVIPKTDAMNIDLKCFSDEGYRRLGGDLSQVKTFLELAACSETHLEITTLIVPGLSDSPDAMEQEATWIASLDPKIPLHVTRYFPRYRAEEPATDVQHVYRLADVARRFLENVFVGNC